MFFLWNNLFNEEKGQFNVENKRYQMLFAFENVYGIFRICQQKVSLKSVDYELVDFNYHESVSPMEVLKDLFYHTRSGETILEINDIVCIKINGATVSYRYSGLLNHDPEQSYKSFVEIEDFLLSEKTEYINWLHRENKVLNVMDGKVYSLSEINFKEWSFYSIDKEIFKKQDRTAGIASDYSLYSLRNFMIQEITPFRKPFITVQHALFYFNKYKQQCFSMLLLNRAELERIKDYGQLKQLLA